MPKKNTPTAKIDGDPPKTGAQPRKASAKGQGSRKAAKPPSARSQPPALPWYHPDSPAREEMMMRLAAGESLRSICRDTKYPAEAVVRRRAINDEEFGSQYARARELGLYSMAEEIIEIADTPVKAEVTRIERAPVLDADGNEIGKIVEKEITTIADDVAHRKLQTDNRKWTLSKLLPKVFGDRVEHNVTTTDVKELKIEFVEADKKRPRARYIDGTWVDVTPEEGD